MSRGFADNLRNFRRAAGLSQVALAEKLGLSRDAIAKMESGHRKPSWETALKISEVLRVSLEDLRKET